MKPDKIVLGILLFIIILLLWNFKIGVFLLVLLLLFCIGLMILFWIMNLIADVDKVLDKNNPKEAYTQRGGLFVGFGYWYGLRSSWPLAKINISKDSISISTLIGGYTIQKAEITALKRYGWGGGIKIEHSNASESPYIVFWPSSYKKLKANLERLGYEIKE